jgi:ribosome-associated toxin RatA of RatAB toxin-antitoxin module
MCVWRVSRIERGRVKRRRDRLGRVWLRPCVAGAVILCIPLVSAGGDETCIACEADRRALERISPQTWRALEAGEVVVESDPAEGENEPGAQVARARALFPHRASALWKVLTAFETWPRFLPNLRKTEVLRREGNRVWLRNQLQILWVDVQSAPIYVLQPRLGRITWRLDPTRAQDLERVEGAWQVVPLEGRDVCLVEYRVLVSVGRGVPRFVEEMLTRRSLPDVLRNLRREVDASTARSRADDGG